MRLNLLPINNQKTRQNRGNYISAEGQQGAHSMRTSRKDEQMK